MSEDNKLLYHYCPIEAFYEIIKNKSIRLSDISKSNDYKEIKWFIDLLSNSLYERLLSCGFSFPEGGNPSELIKDEFKRISRELQQPVYVACFSYEKDLLSQWRGYAKDGSGVSMGFSKSKLSSIFADWRLHVLAFLKDPSYTHFGMRDVIYEIEAQKKLVDKCISSALPQIKFGMHLRNQNQASLWEIVKICYLCAIRSTSSIECKNPAFKEENEARIFFNLPYSFNIEMFDDNEEQKYAVPDRWNQEFQTENKQFINNVFDFQVRNNKIVSYYDLFIDPDIFNDTIEEVIIGPKSQLTILDIKLFLQKHGLNARISVKQSEASYC